MYNCRLLSLVGCIVSEEKKKQRIQAKKPETFVNMNEFVKYDEKGIHEN